MNFLPITSLQPTHIDNGLFLIIICVVVGFIWLGIIMLARWFGKK